MLEQTDDMLMMDPPPLAIICGRKARIMRYWAVTLRLLEKSQASSSQSRMVPA
ncbi:hypothetical protein D3C81_1896430 [compost metagenome]